MRGLLLVLLLLGCGARAEPVGDAGSQDGSTGTDGAFDDASDDSPSLHFADAADAYEPCMSNCPSPRPVVGGPCVSTGGNWEPVYACPAQKDGCFLFMRCGCTFFEQPVWRVESTSCTTCSGEHICPVD